jgi:hypothetical protein
MAGSTARHPALHTEPLEDVDDLAVSVEILEQAAVSLVRGGRKTRRSDRHARLVQQLRSPLVRPGLRRAPPTMRGCRHAPLQ